MPQPISEVPRASPQMIVTVLLSGGIDSAACAAFYQGLGHKVSALHVDYGQAARRNERKAAIAIAEHFQIPLQIVAVHGVQEKPDGEIIGRNAFLIALALQESGFSSQLIAMGVHAGTHYCDCSPKFVDLMNALLSFQSDGRVQVGAPFVSWMKRQIWDFSIKNRVPTSLTYSCERGGDEPCGECLSCRDVRRLYAC